jgi:hypothetical protein
MRTVSDDFWAQVDRSAGPGGCWPWLRRKQKGGYGQLHTALFGRPRTQLTHVVAFFLHFGWQPCRANGLVVRHTCDNPPCCNPAHLVSGTQKQNVRDAIERGRMRPEHKARPGAGNGRAKLDDQKVAEIRARLTAGEPRRALRQEFGIGASVMSRIARRESWDHVA